MKKADRFAYEYLLNKYKKEEIYYSKRGVPKFLTADEKGYHPKLYYNGAVRFSLKEFEKLRKKDHITVLFFDTNGKLITTAKSTELKSGIFRGMKIAIFNRKENVKYTTLTIFCTSETCNRFKKHASKWKTEEAFLNYLLSLYEFKNPEVITL